jgi:hypothetical protein
MEDRAMTVVLVIVAFVVLFVGVWFLDPLRWYEKKLAARVPLSDDSMIEYFATGSVAPNIPGKVRDIFAKHMAYPAEKLLPDDDLNVFWNDFDMCDVIREFEETFEVTIVDKDCEGTPCTIRSVAELIARKLQF